MVTKSNLAAFPSIHNTTQIFRYICQVTASSFYHFYYFPTRLKLFQCNNTFFQDNAAFLDETCFLNFIAKSFENFSK
jgi:hypothetical protein